MADSWGEFVRGLDVAALEDERFALPSVHEHPNSPTSIAQSIGQELKAEHYWSLRFERDAADKRLGPVTPATPEPIAVTLLRYRALVRRRNSAA